MTKLKCIDPPASLEKGKVYKLDRAWKINGIAKHPCPIEEADKVSLLNVIPGCQIDRNRFEIIE
jgi:hypothetical protein